MDYRRDLTNSKRRRIQTGKAQVGEERSFKELEAKNLLNKLPTGMYIFL